MTRTIENAVSAAGATLLGMVLAIGFMAGAARADTGCTAEDVQAEAAAMAQGDPALIAVATEAASRDCRQTLPKATIRRVRTYYVTPEQARRLFPWPHRGEFQAPAIYLDNLPALSARPK